MAHGAMTQEAASGGQFATFVIDGQLYGIGVLQVQEVLRGQEMTRVPLAPGVVEGLINLRGQIVTALDMRRRLRLPPRPDGQVPMSIVIQADDGAVSLLVDEIGDVVETDQAAFEHPPDNIDSAARELVTGVFKLKDRLLLVLDTRKALQVAAKAAARQES